MWRGALKRLSNGERGVAKIRRNGNARLSAFNALTQASPQ
jgi:hypothetical protein